MKNLNAICVLGMHRSGTSALAGSLRCIGVDFGPDLMPGQKGVNTRGFWEHLEIVELHDTLLSELHSSWDDIRPLPDRWWESRPAHACQTRILQILKRDFSNTTLWGIKDPRLCRLLPMWRAIFEEAGTKPHYAITLRHPAEIAASLKKRDGFDELKSYALYLAHVLSAEKWTRGEKRTFIQYENLISDPAKSLQVLIEALDIMDPKILLAKNKELLHFLDGRLHHQQTKSVPAAQKASWPYKLAINLHSDLSDYQPSKPSQTASAFDKISAMYNQQIAGLDPVALAHIEDIQKSRLNHLQATRDLGQERIDSLKIMKDLETKLEERTLWAKTRDEDLARSRIARLELQKQLSTRTLWLEKLKKEITTLQSAHTVLQHAFEERSEWAKSRDAELARTVKIHNDLQSELESRTRWAEAIQKELEALRALHAKLQNDFEERTQWAKARDAELARLQKAHLTLRDELEERTHWAKNRDSELTRLNSAYLVLQAEFEERTQWALSLNRDLDLLRQTHQKLQAEFEERTQWALRLNQDIEQMRHIQQAQDLTIKRLKAELASVQLGVISK